MYVEFCRKQSKFVAFCRIMSRSNLMGGGTLYNCVIATSSEVRQKNVNNFKISKTNVTFRAILYFIKTIKSYNILITLNCISSFPKNFTYLHRHVNNSKLIYSETYLRYFKKKTKRMIVVYNYYHLCVINFSAVDKKDIVFLRGN